MYLCDNCEVETSQSDLHEMGSDGEIRVYFCSPCKTTWDEEMSRYLLQLDRLNDLAEEAYFRDLLPSGKEGLTG